jgi:diguanylate cyclase (GGDEF)-like protein/PAS domain S-box-containing protein
MLKNSNNSENPNMIANFFIKTCDSKVFSIVNITSIIYIVVLGLTFKDFYHVMEPWIIAAQSIGVITIIANLFLLYITNNSPRSAGIMLFCMFAIHMVNITFAGGISTPHFAWIFIFPILAGGTLGWRGQIFFYLICFTGTVFYAVFPQDMVLAYSDSMSYTLFTRLMALTVFTLIMMVYYFTLNEKISHVTKALRLASFESGLFLGVFNSKAQSVLLINPDGRILRANDKAHATFGFNKNSLLNTSIIDLCHSGLEELNKPNSERPDNEPSMRETRITTNAGNTLWVEFSSLNIADENGVSHTLITLEDITTRKNHESELSYLAHYDHLTKLPNRLSIQEQLDDMISNAKRYQFEFAVIFFDLDKFKNVNDIQGHIAGDKVLVEVANRLQENIRRSDVVARFGGDEFVLLLNNIVNPKQVVDLVQKLQQCINEVIIDDSNEYFVGSSAGVAMYPQDGKEANDLIRKADLAMYKAKSAGRGSYEFYSAQHDDNIKRQIMLGSELHYAIERDELTLLFQPIFDIHDKICGAEALVRWKHDELGRVSPDEFIPISEENGLIVPIGLWVLEESCKVLKSWHAMGFEHLVMSVNVSYRQINSDDMVAELARVLSTYQLEGKSIILELTERVFADDLDLVQSNIKQFAEYGVNTAIDDFGVGYSSLSYLKKTDFSSIKIDRSFIKDIETNSASRNLCAAIASMAASLGLSVTAEGVELQAHLDILKRMNINKYQGFLMSKPISEAEFASLLSSVKKLDS